MKKLVRITTIPLSLEKLLGKQLSYMNNFYEVLLVSSNESELKKVSEKLALRYQTIDMTREITPFKDLKSFWKMYQFLKKEKPDIVHTHTPKAGIIGMMASYFAKVPVRMHTVAGLPLLESSGYKRKILIIVEKITYKFSTQVYTNSFGLRDVIIKEKFCSAKKIKVIGYGSSNGIDLNSFNKKSITENDKIGLRKKLNISEQDFVYIFVGRLVKDKGINELVDVFAKLTKINSNIKLLLVGPFEDNLDPVKKETIIQITNNKNIITVGYQENVIPFFSIAHVLVFPSYREGFPNVVLQAAAMELPCIVTDINGCNEIIQNGINGIIIPPKNKEQLYKAMLQLYEDKDLCSQLKQNSRESIKKFDQNLIWQLLKKEYDDNVYFL